MHGNGDYDEILQVEKNALEDEGVKEALKKLQLPEGTVVCADPWIYGKYEQLQSHMISDNSRLRRHQR
jgi:hypothetical protein